MQRRMAWCVTIRIFSERSSSIIMGSRRITTSRYLNGSRLTRFWKRGGMSRFVEKDER